MHRLTLSNIVTCGMACVVIYIVGRLAPYVYRRNRLRWSRAFLKGVRPLMIIGGGVGMLLVWLYVREEATGPFWSVVVSCAAFLYLWWLASLQFDLVFVWHRYIRQSVALINLDRLIPRS